MKIKKYQAKSFSEALACIKRELGKDAVILSTEDRKGIRPYVEVTAAIDYDIEPYDTKAQIPPSHATSDNIMELKNDIRGLRESIEVMRNTGFELTLPAERKNLFYFLREKAIKDEFALRLAERAGSIEDLEGAMSDDMNTLPPFRDSLLKMSNQGAVKCVMLIGPSGVGKTTTIAKLASKAIKEGRRVGMISLDTFKIGAVEQIRIYSRVLGIPLDVISNAKELKKSVKKFSDRELLLIDTTGQNPRDKDYIRGLKEVYSAGLPIETQLVLSTTSDCDFLMETHRHYNSLPVDYLAFTKTDEAVRLGSIYNLCSTYKKPIAYITTGQRVPGNIEFIDSGKLTNIILTTGSAK